MADDTIIVLLVEGIAALAEVVAVFATKSFGYRASKHSRPESKMKKESVQNLESNYMNLQKLAGLANDMEKAVAVKEESNKNSSTFKTWRARAAEIQVELRDLLDQYEDVSRCRRMKKKVLLSKNMEDKCMEVAELVKQGQRMIAYF